MPGTRNAINARRPTMRLAGPRRPPPPVDAATLAANVLDRIALEARVAEMTAARHAVSGCPSPGACRACEGAERRRLDELRRERRALHETDERELRSARRDVRIGRMAEGLVASARAGQRFSFSDAGRSCHICHAPGDGTDAWCSECGAIQPPGDRKGHR
jgi:hypothetical protein